MDSPVDVFPAENRCEVCGGELGDEIVIQEFADGSLARLCPECAAGAALDERPHPEEKSPEVIWPTEPAEASNAAPDEFDPLEKTRELLMPVTDLIALQGEMQGALERLAASLERFAAEMITESQDKNTVESRLKMLERELDKTRARLEETEFLLVSTMETAPGALASVTAATPAAAPPASEDAAAAVVPDGAMETALVSESATTAPEDLWSRLESKAAGASGEAEPAAAEPSLTFPAAEAGPVAEAAPTAEAAAADATPEVEPAAAVREEVRGTGFRIEEVQAAQRYYNESPFTNRVRDVRQSLGKPKANLTRIPGDEPRAVVTIAWDIVWYQYLVDLRRDLPSGQERVVLHREGMDLDELTYYFKEPNAVVNDDGRLDASELEVRLLSDPAALITEMTQQEMQALEDATEEIWDQRISPEFKWDD